MKNLLLVVTVFVSAMASGAEVNQEIVLKSVEPKTASQTPTRPKVVPPKPLTVQEMLEREQVRRQELEMAAKIAAEAKGSKPIIPAAGLVSTQSGGAPISGTLHVSGGGQQGTSVPANLYVEAPQAPQAPQPPQLPDQAKKSGFFRKVGQAVGLGAFQKEYPAPLARYAATHGARGASEFAGVPYRTTEQVTQSSYDHSTPSFYGDRWSKGYSYHYRKETRPDIHLPGYAAPRSYVELESSRHLHGPQRESVPGGRTQIFRFDGRR